VASPHKEAAPAWQPLRIRLFRTLWIAALASNVGLWMQTVGAQWLLVHVPNAAILVSLVQTATALPAVLFALVGGVLADILDRVKLMVTVLACMTVTAAALTALTAAHRMPPALLLLFTFVLGTGTVLVLPAYQSLVPDMVPRQELPNAAALNSISINLARAIGPAVAGILIAQIGVAAVFGLDAAALLGYAVVMAAHPGLGGHLGQRERFLPALRAGQRYVRNDPVERRILLRAALFLVPASALWALLPLVATRRLGLGSGGYGALLAALGVGAIAGALLLPQARARLSMNVMTAAASLLYAAVMVVVVLWRDLAFTLAALLFAGLAWTMFLSNVNAALQIFLPKWVRARGLAVYQMVLFGGQAAGAVLWGLVGDVAGLVPAFLASAAVLAAGAATIGFWPFRAIGKVGQSPVQWPEPQLTVSAEADSPVLVQITYTIAPSKEQEFLQAMTHMQQSRLRTGATRWNLYRDGEKPDQLVEQFTVPSWDEHLRQHRERQTGADLEYHSSADALSDPPPQITHYLATSVGD
jgi:MFS family permease/quinol monooxygenase YgiN